MTDEPTGGTEHTVSQGDVSVHRVVETDGTGVVATVELRSATDEPVRVEMVETVPDEFTVESTGFKPEAMPDGKAVSEERLSFEQTVADEPEEVAYGLMLADPVETVAFDPPTIETVEPVAAGATKGNDGSAGDRGVEVRLDRLSARVEEFAAYAESLGTLVYVHGSSDEFADHFDERTSDIDDWVASPRVEFDEAVETVHDDVDSLDDELAALRDAIDEVTTSMERVREEMATLRDELGELQAVRESLSEALSEQVSTSRAGVESSAEPAADSEEESVVSDGVTGTEEGLDDEYGQR